MSSSADQEARADEAVEEQVREEEGVQEHQGEAAEPCNKAVEELEGSKEDAKAVKADAPLEAAEAVEAFQDPREDSEEDTDSYQPVEEDQGVVTLSSSEESETREAAPPDTQIPVEPTLEETPFKMSGTAEPTANKSLFMPPKPRMGKIVQVGTDTYVPVLGNIPKPDFLGLLDDGQGQFKSTEQQRSLTAKYNNPERQTRGIEPKLSVDGSLFEFAENFNRDLFKTGSAILAHLPHPADRSMQQLNVLEHHSLFLSLSEAKKLAEEQYKKFDEYDVRTDAENMEKFHNSLDEKLLKTLKNLTPNKENSLAPTHRNHPEAHAHIPPRHPGPSQEAVTTVEGRRTRRRILNGRSRARQTPCTRRTVPTRAHIGRH
jgi:hypothetical protein